MKEERRKEKLHTILAYSNYFKLLCNNKYNSRGNNERVISLPRVIIVKKEMFR